MQLHLRHCLVDFAKEIHFEMVTLCSCCHVQSNRAMAVVAACEADNDGTCVEAVAHLNREIEPHLVADDDNSLLNTKLMAMPNMANYRRHRDSSDTSQTDDCNKTPFLLNFRFSSFLITKLFFFLNSLY